MKPTIAAVVFWAGIAAIPLSAQDFLVWTEGRRLAWNDFRAPPATDRPDYHGAESRLSIAVGLTCANNVPDLTIRAEFDRNRSWARPNMSPGLLDHEQIHFDIAELYARRTREEAANVANPCQNAAAIRAIAERNHVLAEGLQDAYDEETHHGTRPDVQAEWARRIRSLLDVQH